MARYDFYWQYASPVIDDNWTAFPGSTQQELNEFFYHTKEFDHQAATVEQERRGRHNRPPMSRSATRLGMADSLLLSTTTNTVTSTSNTATTPADDNLDDPAVWKRNHERTVTCSLHGIRALQHTVSLMENTICSWVNGGRYLLRQLRRCSLVIDHEHAEEGIVIPDDWSFPQSLAAASKQKPAFWDTSAPSDQQQQQQQHSNVSSTMASPVARSGRSTASSGRRSTRFASNIGGGQEGTPATTTTVHEPSSRDVADLDIAKTKLASVRNILSKIPQSLRNHYQSQYATATAAKQQTSSGALLQPTRHSPATSSLPQAEEEVLTTDPDLEHFPPPSSGSRKKKDDDGTAIKTNQQQEEGPKRGLGKEPAQSTRYVQPSKVAILADPVMSVKIDEMAKAFQRAKNLGSLEDEAKREYHHRVVQDRSAAAEAVRTKHTEGRPLSRSRFERKGAGASSRPPPSVLPFPVPEEDEDLYPYATPSSSPPPPLPHHQQGDDGDEAEEGGDLLYLHEGGGGGGGDFFDVSSFEQPPSFGSSPLPQQRASSPAPPLSGQLVEAPTTTATEGGDDRLVLTTTASGGEAGGSPPRSILPLGSAKVIVGTKSTTSPTHPKSQKQQDQQLERQEQNTSSLITVYDRARAMTPSMGARRLRPPSQQQQRARSSLGHTSSSTTAVGATSTSASMMTVPKGLMQRATTPTNNTYSTMVSSMCGGGVRDVPTTHRSQQQQLGRSGGGSRSRQPVGSTLRQPLAGLGLVQQSSSPSTLRAATPNANLRLMSEQLDATSFLMRDQ